MPAVTLGVVTVQIDDHDVEGVSITVQRSASAERNCSDRQGRMRLYLRDCRSGLIPPTTAAWDETTSLRTGRQFRFRKCTLRPAPGALRGAASGQYYVKRIRYGPIESSDPEFSLSADGDTLEVTLSGRGARVSGVVRRNDTAGSGRHRLSCYRNTDAELRRYDTHEGALDQSGAFIVKEACQAGRVHTLRV